MRAVSVPEASEGDEKPENESGEPPASGAVIVSLDLARVVPPKKAAPPTPKQAPKKPPRPTIAEQLAAQKKRAKAEAEAARKASKKARPGKGSSARDALFRGFAQSLERASKQGEGFAPATRPDGGDDADDRGEPE